MRITCVFIPLPHLLLKKKKKKIHVDIIQLYTLVIKTTMHDMMCHLVFNNKYHENSLILLTFFLKKKFILFFYFLGME